MRQLRGMRKLERLARFHEVSADRETWVPASSLAALYPPAVAPAGPDRQHPRAIQPGASMEVRGDSTISHDDSPDAWFYAKEDQACGPLGIEELGRLIADGGLMPTTLVWCEGMASWVPYCELPTDRPAPPPGSQ
jgi:hypothetical protein